jgi:hypothetical protein
MNIEWLFPEKSAARIYSAAGKSIPADLRKDLLVNYTP